MDKLDKLKQIIAQGTSAVVAFSGGVDSTFLACIAGEVLPGKVLLVTAMSSTYPASELDESKRLAALLQLPQKTIISEELDIDGFADNTPQRCYYCKKTLFSHILKIARDEGFEAVFDGSNIDDQSDYRPGRRATKELGIRSPLFEAGLTKNEIREYSKKLGLPTAAKPSLACLASRFPYGEKITREKLGRVGMAEEALRSLGFSQLRVRSHGDVARVELLDAEMDAGWARRSAIQAACKKAGFTFVAIDTQGYRTGAMNETLDRDQEPSSAK
jgi:pyridinium-3,5-biscarboxylic acid mononucleotide sulfurtransferase